MGLNVRNPVRHVPYFKETGRMRALTLEEVDKYLAAAKGDLKDFAALALDTGARPMELLALHKNDVHLTEGYVSLPGTKNVRARRDVPLTDGAKEVLERRISKSPNGYIFPVRRRKTKHKEVQHITSLKKAHERIIAKYFADDPFTPYTFRHTYGTRHSQAGTELPVLAELMGHAEIQTSKPRRGCKPTWWQHGKPSSCRKSARPRVGKYRRMSGVIRSMKMNPGPHKIPHKRQNLRICNF
jgi:integrase